MQNSAFKFRDIQQELKEKYNEFSIEIAPNEDIFRLSHKNNETMYALITNNLNEIIPFVSGFYTGKNNNQ